MIQYPQKKNKSSFLLKHFAVSGEQILSMTFFSLSLDEFCFHWTLSTSVWHFYSGRMRCTSLLLFFTDNPNPNPN